MAIHFSVGHWVGGEVWAVDRSGRELCTLLPLALSSWVDDRGGIYSAGGCLVVVLLDQHACLVCYDKNYLVLYQQKITVF